MTPQPHLKLADDTTRKPPSRFKFTAASIAKAKAPTKGRRYVYDTGEPGLAMMVTHTGSRSWYFYRKVDGRPMRLKLGNVADVSIEQARKLTRQHKGKIADGGDPAEERRVKRGEMTLNELWGHYQDEHAATNCTEKTRVADTSLYNVNLRDTLGARKLSAIRPATVKALHAEISERGRTTANRAVQLLTRLYKFGAAQYDIEVAPPIASVKLHKETSRTRFMDADELRRFFDALKAEDEIWQHLFALFIFTGARRSNVQAMRWQDIDLGAAVWTIQAEEYKSHHTTPIPLPPEAVDILKKRHADAEDSAWVFPAQRVMNRKDGGTTEHIGQPLGVWRRVIKRSGIKNLRMHDLRRTKGAWLASAGASLTIVGAALGHRDHRSTAIYARLTDDAVRTQTNAIASAMTEAINAKPEKGGKAKKKKTD